MSFAATLIHAERTAVEYLGGTYALPIYTFVAVFYIVINLAISLLASRMQRRIS